MRRRSTAAPRHDEARGGHREGTSSNHDGWVGYAASGDANPDSGEFAESLKPIGTQGRYGHTDDVAALVSFLAGPESGYITGAHLNIDGGFTV